MYVFPGAVDCHVHFNEPGREEWEGIETGSNMLAAGGCTAYFDMPLNCIPSTVTVENLLAKAEIAERKSSVDFALWGGLMPGYTEHIRPMAEAGAIGFKAFLSKSGTDEFQSADERTLLKGMKEIAACGKILPHAESDALTRFLEAEYALRGKIDARAYASSRPEEAECEAVQRAIEYARATGCALHFVHISTKRAVLSIQQAKKTDWMSPLKRVRTTYYSALKTSSKRGGRQMRSAAPLRG